ncbi:MAG: hypothetical protein ACXVW1_05120 [Nocardioides sp.]
MTSTHRTSTPGSRTAAYVVCAVLAAVPAWVVLLVVLRDPLTALVALGVLALIGGVWLLKRRQDDPDWDRRLPSGAHRR